MKKRIFTAIIMCNILIAFTACAQSGNEEVTVTEATTSDEGRGENYLEFQREEAVKGIETLKIEIVDADGNLIEEITVEKPQVDDKYCISPVITDDLRLKGTYNVIFTVNDTDTWERTFDIEDCDDNIHTNVIDIYEENGEIHYESCLAS